MYYILAASIHSDYAFPGQTYRIQHEMPIKIANLGTTIITQTDHETQQTTNPIKPSTDLISSVFKHARRLTSSNHKTQPLPFQPSHPIPSPLHALIKIPPNPRHNSLRQSQIPQSTPLPQSPKTELNLLPIVLHHRCRRDHEKREE